MADEYKKTSELPAATEILSADLVAIVQQGASKQIDMSTLFGAITLPSGAVMMFGGATAPSGWLLCNGAAVNRTTYADLFTAIGTTFGIGDGSTTFNLPDFGGIFPRGAGTNTQLDDAGGSAFTATLGAYQEDAEQGHRHALLRVAGNTGSDQAYAFDGSGGDAGFEQVGDPLTDGVNGTPRTDVETRPANLAINFIIKA